MKARSYWSVAHLLSFQLLLTSVAACSLSAYQNRRLATETPPPSIATLNVDGHHQGNKDVLVLLALSGGGSRAAYFSASTMLALQKVYTDVDILSKVDAISSVSGGSLAAAYYGLSQDPSDAARATDKSKPLWEPETVKSVMSLNYTARWLAEGFLLRIWNWPRSWLTSYNRTDALAETFNCDLLYAGHSCLFHHHTTFHDLNPLRPRLIINATNGTSDYDDQPQFARLFTFTQEDFRNEVGADINEYPLAFAVAASAAFPGVFNYLTLRDYDHEGRYTHLFDGGSYDNLGLSVFKPIILENMKRYKHIVVISIDASASGVGVDGEQYDVRHWTDRFVDTDFMASFDMFLSARRTQVLRQFVSGQLVDDNSDNEIGYDKVATVRVDNLTFWHVTFDAVPNAERTLKRDLRKIPTAFSISKDNQEDIDDAVALLVKPDDPCLQRIHKILRTGVADPKDACRIENQEAEPRLFPQPVQQPPESGPAPRTPPQTSRR